MAGHSLGRVDLGARHDEMGQSLRVALFGGDRDPRLPGHEAPRRLKHL